jgi:hypothetical protein
MKTEEEIKNLTKEDKEYEGEIYEWDGEQIGGYLVPSKWR